MDLPIDLDARRRTSLQIQFLSVQYVALLKYPRKAPTVNNAPKQVIRRSINLKSRMRSVKGVPSAESSHTLWGLGKGISRQPFPCILLCKEADSIPGPPGHK